MQERFILTVTILVLGMLIFTYSMEATVKMENWRFFNYANPTYILMTVAGIGGVTVAFYCLLDLWNQAKKLLVEQGETESE